MVVGLWTGDGWPSAHLIAGNRGFDRGGRLLVEVRCGQPARSVSEERLRASPDLSRKTCEACLRLEKKDAR